jgi:hypothetical protein
VVDPGGAAWDVVARDAVQLLLNGISTEVPAAARGRR